VLDQVQLGAGVGAGVNAERRFPGVAVYLAACGPCGEDFHGLLAAVRGQQLTGP
jgi:hypothetical protein